MLVARRNNDLMSTMFNELLDWNRWNNLCTTEDHTAAPKMNVSESDKDYQLEKGGLEPQHRRRQQLGDRNAEERGKETGRRETSFPAS